MTLPNSRRTMALAWIAALALCTLVMLPLRSQLDKAHISLVLLLLVLFASAVSGRAIGIGIAGLSFLVFNWFFLPPYGTFVIANALDWLVLLAFLLTSIVAAQLLYRAQEEARVARATARDIDRLASLGAETLNVARADEAIAAVAEVIRSSLHVDACEIYVRSSMPNELSRGARAGTVEDDVTTGPDSMLAWVVEQNGAAVQRQDGTVRLGAAERMDADVRTLMTPLRVRDRTVGVLRLTSAGGLRLDAERARFLEAISYYAALAVERARLAAEAEHADALREADRLKDAFVASVSHDMRTPLTTIKALAHDLASLGDERAEIIEQEADRLNRTVSDLLDLSRIQAGALPLRIELNAVDDLLGALVERVEPALDGRRLTIDLPLDEPLLVGRFDLVHTLRAITNLVENAVKYSPRDSAVTVSARRVGASIEIRVADQGPGLSAASTERLFEPFYRPPGTPPDVGGAGLGLSIARRLAEAQDGSLHYEHGAQGGSVFILRVPAAELTAMKESL